MGSVMGKASRLVVTMVMDLNTAVTLSVTLSILSMSPIHRQGSQTGACSPGTKNTRPMLPSKKVRVIRL